MGYCCVVGCKNRVDKRRNDGREGVRFFSFPKVIAHQCAKTLDLSKRRRALWIARVNRKNLQDADIKTHTKVCSAHFILGAPSALFDENHPDWVPSLNLGYPSKITERALQAMKKYSRSKERYLKSKQSKPEQPVQVNQEENAAGEQQDQDLPVQETPVQVLNQEENAPGDQQVQDFPVPIIESCSQDQSQKNGAVDTESTTALMRSVSPRSDLDSQSAFKELEKQYNEISEKYKIFCKNSKGLRDRVTDLEVDKLELVASLKSSDEVMKSLKVKVVELEGEVKNQQEIIEMERKAHKEIEMKVKECEVELQSLRQLLKEANKIIFSDIEAFLADEGRVKFYTGLPSSGVFKVLVDGLCSFFKEQSVDVTRFALQPWQCLLLTLMRLRLALTLQDLAYRFGVHLSTACRVFERYIDAMYKSIYPLLVKWPDRETLWETMPREFRESYGNSVAVIIDCFEIFTDKPSSLENRAMIWSNYKHHHTVKILVGISPTGAVIFVSTAWGARASDKHLVEESGLYELLLPHDVVMADRGFNIAEHLAMHGAKLLIPAFTRGQQQLSSHDVSLTRKIANLRIHVERVIGLVRRKFRILKSILPVDLLTLKEGEEFAPIDKIVRVCCALVNVCPSIVVHPDTHDATDE